MAGLVLALLPAPAGTAPAPQGDGVPPPFHPGFRRDAPVPLGLAADVSEGWRVAILSVTPNANQSIAATTFGSLLEPGTQAFVARVLVSRTGTDADTFAVGARLRTSGPSATVYSAFRDACRSVPDRFDADAQIVFAGTHSGNVCWQVTADDAPSLLVYHDPPPRSDWPRVYFALSH